MILGMWKRSPTEAPHRSTNVDLLTNKQMAYNANQINRAQTCEPKKNIVFLKTHKTGGSTIWWIMQNFALQNKLQVVVPITGLSFSDKSITTNVVRRLFSPMGIRKGDYTNYKYNVFSIHARFNRDVFDSFMKKNTTYVTILRNPVTQFESAFDYFSIGGRKGNKTSRLREWMEHPFLNWKKSKMKFATHNCQIRDLGINPSLLNANDIITKIKKLDTDFDFVMITEMFDESLIILKKMMCWRFEDIVYFPKKKRYSQVSLSKDLVLKIGNWNALDMKLYDYFRRRFDDHVKNYGPNFQSDLDAFRKIKSFLSNVCLSSFDSEKSGKSGNLIVSYNYNLNFTDVISTKDVVCKRVRPRLHKCNIGGSQIVSFDFSKLCYDLTLKPKEFIPRILRNMMHKGNEVLGQREK
ncbi:galactosylceramide sulfotransferase-like [Antedon mediterranea]|uniref:galactosylceramide sulfotransferase-like n=1 Tax=Antedon mediterranea TaxID=105859 RepID=UPI003AF40EA6